MSRSTCFAVAMIPFLMIWCGVADGAPLFGLLSLLGASSTNSSSLLSSLLTSHLQSKLNALAIASDLLAMLSNVTAIG